MTANILTKALFNSKMKDYLVGDNQHLHSITEYNQGMFQKWREKVSRYQGKE
jgi:hypothetical protein